MQKWIQPPACSDPGLHRILSSYWLAHFYLMKLFWFGLRDMGILYSLAVIQRTIDVSPTFLEHCSAERSRFEHMQTVIQTSMRRNHFCMKRLRTLNSYQIFKIKSKNPKTYRGCCCPFQCLSNCITLMHIQSGRTVTLRTGKVVFTCTVGRLWSHWCTYSGNWN